ncbi:MAG: sporulation integral membrane protein YtvI [Defluviitaleaceae bacterium]|nr:sporulation integral membrane protein YtvI [Defluviitaleaceae bacterium]MCL2262973.1 sporulation integral membrane protein YtvI [Defluviitaleaceae bacterium]
MREFYNENKERIDRILFLILVTVAFYLFFTVFFVYLSPFFIGLIIALVMEPLNRLLERKMGFKRWVGSLLCLLVFIAVVGSLGAWLVSTLVRQVTSFAESAPMHITELSARLDEANVWLQRFTVHLPDGWYIPNIEEMLPAALGLFFGGGMAETGLRTLGGVPDFFLNLILGLVSAYFFMSDGKRIFRFVKNICPRWIRGQMRQTKKGLTLAMSGYFRAQAILMVMVGVISIAGLLILRNPYALLLGLLFAALDFLPILGPALVLLPWALISVIMGNMRQAIGLLVIWGIITIARQVLQPKILGTQMGAHPLASLMSIYIGFRIFGLFGLIIGPTLLMIIIAIFDTNEERNAIM